MPEEKQKRELWIDYLKGICILMVVMTHSRDYLINNIYLNQIYSFQVGTFFIIAGINIYDSLTRADIVDAISWKNWIWKHIKALIFPYALATAVIQVFSTGKLDFFSYIYYLKSFNAASPYYYILIYIQYVLIAYVIYRIVVKTGVRNSALKTTVILITSLALGAGACVSSTVVPDAWGGGKYLFGGTYLIAFVYGMARGKIKKYNPLLLVLAAAYIAFVILMKGRSFIKNESLLSIYYNRNPPGLYNLQYIFASYYLLSWALRRYCNSGKHVKAIDIILKALKTMGKYSLSIYLYHWLLIMIYEQYIFSYMENVFEGYDIFYFIFKIIIYSLFIIIPIMGNQIYKRIKTHMIGL